MTALAGFWRNKTPAPPPADAAPAPMRVAHGITALGIIAIFLALHLLNHLTFILGPDTFSCGHEGDVRSIRPTRTSVGALALANCPIVEI